MKPLISPMDMVRLSTQSGMMLVEANMVIVMRLWGMAGMWKVTSGENKRMLDEKSTAAMASGAAMARAMVAGHGPAAVAMAGLKPVRAKTRANAARLAKRGPGAPG